MTKRVAWGLSCIVWVAACGRVGQEVAHEVQKATAEEVKAPELKPVTEQEASSYAQDMLKAVQAADATAVERLIDFQVMVRRALAGVQLPEQMVTDTAAGVATGARQTGLVAQLANQTKGGAAFTLLSTRLDRDGRWASFRSLPPAGGFEHYEFLLSKTDGDKVVAVDAFFLSAGEKMSVSMRRLLIGAFAADKSFLQRLSAQENLFVKHLPELNRAREAQAKGQREEALKVLESLPAELKDQKFALLLRMQIAASNPDDPRYAQVLDTLVTKFPNDPAASVAAIDHFLLKKQNDKALAAIEAVEKSTVPDAYLGTLKVNVLLTMNKLDEAKKVALQTIEREPTLLPAHFSLVAVMLQQKDHAATAQQLLKMRDQFKLQYNFDGMPEYAAFVASPEYPAFQRAMAGDAAN